MGNSGRMMSVMIANFRVASTSDGSMRLARPCSQPFNASSNIVITAMAPANPASSQAQIRELQGVQPVAAIIAAGVARVQTVAGQVLESGQVETGEKARPSLLGGRAVLLVEPANGQWQAIRRD